MSIKVTIGLPDDAFTVLRTDHANFVLLVKCDSPPL